MAMESICKYCLYKDKPWNCEKCAFKPFNMSPQKPPLGVVPRHIHDEQRLRDLKECVANYMQAGLTILPEWVEEYNELIKRKEKK